MRPKILKTATVHGGLFVLTFVTTTLAGVQWLNKNPFELSQFFLGLPYSFLLLAFLTAHEMGHYVAARMHEVETTLPFFLPFPPFLIGPFGTFGAVIKIKSELRDRESLLDIGAAGPISGFIVCLCTLAWGLTHLPSIEYLYSIYPEYRKLAEIPTDGLTFGKPLLYKVMELVIAPSKSFLPPMNEIYHYPFLCVGWFGMLVTSLNLLPIGQLDGGHIAYAMFGSRSVRASQVVLVMMSLLGTLGILPLLGINCPYGWSGWLLWSIVLALLLRSRAFRHPAVEITHELGTARTAVGWLCALILIVSFTPTPFSP